MTAGNIAALLVDEFEAYAPVRTNTESTGEFVITYPTVTETVYGRYQSQSSSENEQGERDIGKITPTVYLNPDSNVDLNWKLKRVSDGREMRIARIESPSIPIYIKCVCEETQEEA